MAGAQVAGGNLAPPADDGFAVGGEGEAVPAAEVVVAAPPAGAYSSGSADAEQELKALQLYRPTDEPAKAPERPEEPVPAGVPVERLEAPQPPPVSALDGRRVEDAREESPADRASPDRRGSAEGWALAILVCVPPLLDAGRIPGRGKPGARG